MADHQGNGNEQGGVVASEMGPSPASVTLGSDVIECPLCTGRGELKRSEVLERLGVKDLSRVAQLSAEEVFRMLTKKQKTDEENLWLRFESELNKRTNDLLQKHRNEIQALQGEKATLELRFSELQKNEETVVSNAKQSERLEVEKRLLGEISALDGKIKELQAIQRLSEQQRLVEVERVKTELGAKLMTEQTRSADLTRLTQDHLGEIAKLREANHALEAEMAKIARVGRRQEVEFAEEARSWPSIWISEKLKRHGDYILAYRDPGGSPMDPRIVVDNKDKDSITESDIEKLIRDAKEQGTPVGIVVAKDESQLRQLDKDCRWSSKHGIWILRTTRSWVSRDLEILRPIFDRMRTEGPDFLEKNAALAQDIRRTFVDIDEIEKELKKAAKAVDTAKVLAANYRARLQSLCDSVTKKKEPGPSTAESAEQLAS